MAFAITFIAVLVFQALTIPALHKKMDEDYRWGFYFMKFLSIPLWFAMTFAGPLGIIPGIGLAALVGILGLVLMFVVLIFLFRDNPNLAADLKGDPEDSPEKQKLMNYFAVSWGGLLLAGTLGVLAF